MTSVIHACNNRTRLLHVAQKKLIEYRKAFASKAEVSSHFRIFGSKLIIKLNDQTMYQLVCEMDRWCDRLIVSIPILASCCRTSYKARTIDLHSFHEASLVPCTIRVFRFFVRRCYYAKLGRSLAQWHGYFFFLSLCHTLRTRFKLEIPSDWPTED